MIIVIQNQVYNFDAYSKVLPTQTLFDTWAITLHGKGSKPDHDIYFATKAERDAAWDKVLQDIASLTGGNHKCGHTAKRAEGTRPVRAPAEGLSDVEIAENILKILTATPDLHFKQIVEGLLVYCKTHDKKKVGDGKLKGIRKLLVDAEIIVSHREGNATIYSLPLVNVIPTQTVPIGGQTSICRSSAKPTQTTEG